MAKKKLLDSNEIAIILQRLACQLVENHDKFKDTVLIGLQPRGIFLANRLVKILREEYHIKDLIVENKKVVFIDDVLFSGRSIRAALSAIQSFGRPSNIELLVLIDRRFSRHLPIQPNYKGRQVDAINQEKVMVQWQEQQKSDAVYIES